MTIKNCSKSGILERNPRPRPGALQFKRCAGIARIVLIVRYRRFAGCVALVLVGMLVSAAVGIHSLSRIEEPYITAIQSGVEVPAPPSEQRRWKAEAPPDLAEPPASGRLHARFGARLRSLTRTNLPIDNPNLTHEQFQNLLANRRTFMLWSIECGWPLPCVGGERWYEHRGLTATPVAYSGAKLGIFRMPSRVLWGGLFVNGVLFAVAAYLLLSVPRVVVGAIRRKRGQCSHCGYPIGSSPVCTECGSPVSRPQSASHTLQPPYS